MFRALVLHRNSEGVRPSLDEVSDADLPQGDVLINVAYSSLNYKDGLAITDRGKIVRGSFPFVPGIDLAGTVAESSSDSYSTGDKVVLTGWGTGEDRWGGFAARARASAEHLVALPEGMSLEQSMVIGTAGFTAMLAVMALEEAGIDPTSGEVVVTGASGGVGSVAVLLLARLGFDVVASSGKEAAHDYLKDLGATRVIPREDLGEGPSRPLDRGLWAAGIDSVGGATLAAIISQLRTHGAVASIGLAQSHELHTTVFPFILRGVSLLGIDSNTCPLERRRKAWSRLRELIGPDDHAMLHRETIGLADLPYRADEIVQGGVRGRIVVDPNR